MSPLLYLHGLSLVFIILTRERLAFHVTAPPHKTHFHPGLLYAPSWMFIPHNSVFMDVVPGKTWQVGQAGRAPVLGKTLSR